MSILKRNSFLAMIGFSLSVVCYGIYAQSTTLPPVVVTGYRVDGTTVVCRGYDCADALFQTPRTPFDADVASISDQGGVDGQQFCQNLSAKKPSNCNLNNPPPSPGINVPGQAAWQPNGCGTGGIGTWFQDAILEVVTSQSYSGDIHAPYAGVSFRGACDAHDQCWASGSVRNVCDSTFRSSMSSACSVVSTSAGRGTCEGFASLYHGAVSVTNGAHSAYASSTAKRACALWASDMRENSCAN